MDKAGKGKGAAKLADQGAENEGGLHLGLTDPEPREDQVGGSVGDGRGARELLELFLAFQQAHSANLGAGVDQLAHAGACGDDLGSMQAQVLLLDPDLAQPAQRAAHELIRVLAVAPRDHLGSLGLCAGFLLLERGHDQGRAFALDDESHQPLVRLGMETRQVGDGNRPRDVGRIQVAVRHPAAQDLERSGERGGLTQRR